MWEAVAFFRWAEVDGEGLYSAIFTSKRKALSAARIWRDGGMEVEMNGQLRLVPSGSIHYIEVQEVTE